jgi:hypothetical protein
MKTWSSYPDQKLLHENWRNFLGEEEEESSAPEAEEQLVFGINSRPEINPDSLLSMLEPLVTQGILAHDEKEALIDLMLQAAATDNVVLEALGGKTRDIRTFSDQSTDALNELIRSFGLEREAQSKLEDTLNRWARHNTVKFSETSIGLPSSELPPPWPEDEEEPIAGEPPQEEDWLDISYEEPPVPSIEEPAFPEPRAAPVIRQVRGPGPESYDDEEVETPAEQEKGWSGGGRGWVDATPENAREIALRRTMPSERSHKDYQKYIDSAQQLLKAGAGLQFEDRETEEKTIEPRWVEETDRDGNRELGVPWYRENFMLPRGPSAWFRRVKDWLTVSWDKYDTSLGATMVSEVPAQAIKNLEDLIEMMEEEYAGLQNSEDADALQETFDRWKTIAGINQRVL